jgi:hypothetical protein
MILLLSTSLIALVLYATKDILLSILGPWLSPSPLLRLKGPNWGTLLRGHTHGYSSTQPQPETWLMRVFDKFGPVTVIRAPFNVSSTPFPHALLSYPLPKVQYAIHDGFESQHAYIQPP